MTTLGAVIADRLHEWGAVDLPVEREIFGTAEPDALAGAVDAWCREHLGSRIGRYEFFDSSSGSVHGIVLADGRGVVVKGHRAAVATEYLAAVRDVQATLADAGYPAPRPLAGPVPLGDGHLTAESMLDRSVGVAVDGHDPEVRGALAAGLARFVELTRPHRDALGAVVHPMKVPEGGLYPIPHSPRFDFAATASGAEWIDALAIRARTHAQSAPSVPVVVVHADWRIENLCLRHGRLVAVYDWDSLEVAPEVSAVATAATTFSVDWRQEHGRRFPSTHEIGLFVADYEAARGNAFSDAERDLLAARMVISLAYGARCEHADPGGPPPEDDSQRGLLRAHGAVLLERGVAALRG